MIDLGLAKLAVIGVVALMVIGPEKLPKVARMAGSLIGRAQRYLNEVKAEVGREMELDELRKLQQEMEEAASELRSGLTKEMAEAAQSISSIANNSQEGATLPHVFFEENHFARKASEFRRKKLIRSSALPAWYKQQQGRKYRILSGSARVAKYRPKANSAASSSFY
jgi:sec-independent protein translocase protein TatB